MKRLKFVLTATLLSFGLAVTSSADLVATDLNDGGADEGFTGDWTGSNNVFIIEAPDLTYANYGITQTGELLQQKVYASNAGPDRQDKRSVATPMSGTIWFSVLVNVPAGSEYAGLTFNNFNDSQPWNPIDTEARILLTPSQLQVGFNGEATTTGTGTFDAGTTHLLLGQMNIAAGNDTLNVWVDPNLNLVGGPGGLPAANFTSTEIDFTDLIANIGVAGRKGNGSDVSADAIRVSDTATAFEDVTGVSGPGILFAITEIEYTPDPELNGTVTLTWRKTGAASYIAKFSLDLSDWSGDLDDGVTDERDENPGDTEHITVTFPLEGVQPDTTRLFFRIEEG